MQSGPFDPPEPIRPFIGRETEIREISRLLGERHLPPTVITITGPPGIGKTALVSEIVDRRKAFRPLWIQSNAVTPEMASRLIFDTARSWREPNLRGFLAVLDGLDESRSPELAMERWLRMLLNFKAVSGVIVTTRHRIPAPRNNKNNEHTFFLAPFGKRELEELLFKKGIRRLSTQAKSLLLQKAAGSPLILSSIAELSQTHSLSDVLSHLDGNIFTLKKSDESKIIQAVRPEIITFSGELVHQLKKSPDKLYDVTSRQFEQLVADIFHDKGWEVELTQATRDGGRDILAHLNTGVFKLLCLIEAKKHRKDRPVGVQLVRNLYGTFCDEQANSAMLVTTSYFTPEAKKLEERHKYHLSLKDYTDVVAWIVDYKG